MCANIDIYVSSYTSYSVIFNALFYFIGIERFRFEWIGEIYGWNGTINNANSGTSYRSYSR